MMHQYVSMLLVRGLLPAGLLLSMLIRPFGLSIVYLVLFLLAPLIEVPDKRSFNRCGGTILLLNLVVSCLLLLTHIVWHIVLASFAPYGSLLQNYPLIEVIGLNLGLVSFENIHPFMAIQFLAPELLMVLISALVFVSVKKITAIPTPHGEKKDSKHQRYPLLVSAGKYICLFLIMFSGILRPSVTSGIYFLVFMGAATAWALGNSLEKGFAIVSRCVMAIMAVHVLGLAVYQSSWLVTLYPPDMNMARYFGLTKLIILNETDPYSFSYEVSDDGMWATPVSPIVILLTYFALAIESRELFKPKAKKKSALTGLEAGKLNGSMVRGISFKHGSRIAARDKWMSATKKIRVAYSYINSKALRGNTGEDVPLMRNVSSSKKWTSMRSKNASRQLHQDSTGSVVVPEDDSSSGEEDAPTLLDEIVIAIFEFFQVLIRSSYIATTITMMAWSIMFHSWLTFVLLMWANVVWLCHDQRSFMLKTSPLLVCYAMLLLLAQYIFGMNLYESELPSTLPQVNLAQIGLTRPTGEPCVPLLIKSLFTCMFWVTLRLRMQEIQQRRRSHVISDMAAPLQVTVSTAASGMEAQNEEESRSRLLKILGDWLRAACAKYWIYLVVIMMFVIGVTGERMTIFRIIFMLLFLIFILMFQMSWYWWRRLMYVFWICVIIYSMLNLILIYIYQFDNFSKTIENYLYINEKLQHDLGLEPYQQADLFVKLLTPTLFLIITIMQVHYFHKDFMEWSNPKTPRSSSLKETDARRPSQMGASTIRDDLPQLSMEGEQPPSPETRRQVPPSEGRDVSPSKDTRDRIASQRPSDTNLHSIEMASIPSQHTRERGRTHEKSTFSRSYAGTLTDQRSSRPLKYFWKQRLSAFKTVVDKWMDLTFFYLDNHLVSILFLSLMLLSVANVCALHVPIMLIIVPALWLSASKQRFCLLFISTLISAYMMLVMVYQIRYIEHSFFDVNCTDADLNLTSNNAQWLGFKKATNGIRLVHILKGYIALIALFTFYSLVTYRQRTIRANSDEANTAPDITRKDADKDIKNCVKFLLKYGFYKFGVEITLICLIGVIGSRMDVYAVLYAGWLLVLVSLRRPVLAQIWPAFTVFITVIIPLQYMIAVGFLPQLCIKYPWHGDDERWDHIRTWLFLPYAQDPPNALKLIFDFFLLMFATRQLQVFNIEYTYGDNYAGGSNREDIGQDWETPNFVNPVPDFLGYVCTWLDVVKRTIFLGMLWVTLAIMFLTGTNRVNLFSMGYLIGSFIFLWQGTDFYLRPKDAILRWWSWLVRYNVFVVVVKTLLQIPGCIFKDAMQEYACWLVQLLGIGCVDKFAGNNLRTFIRMNYYDQSDACSVPQEDIGLAWDGVCFAFLIIQRRLFYSYYFYRVIDESKATTVLASRGAELIEELRQKQMLAQKETEIKILDKIKVKMEKIKANQKKIQGIVNKSTRHHDAGSDSSLNRRAFAKRHEARDMQQFRAPSSHQKAVRSGDYYMFDEFDDTEPQDALMDDQSESDEDAPKEMGIGKLLSTAIKTDLKNAVSLRRASAPSVRSTRRLSLGSYPSSYPREVRRTSSRTFIGKSKTPLSDRDQNRDEDRDERSSEMDDYAMPQDTAFDKAKALCDTVSAFISSFLVSLSRHLMKYSRDYRYVSRTLSIEKKALKEKEGFGIGLREGSQMIWEPLPEVLAQNRKLSDISVPEIRILAPSMERGLDASPPAARASPRDQQQPEKESSTSYRQDDDTSEHESAFSLQTTSSNDVTTLEEQDDSIFKQGKSAIVHLGYALWYALMAHTDFACYIMVFINQIQSATILSIPLPLMVFLWGTLTIPRPTKTFWVTLIAYTEVIVLIKSMFQFEILPWNQQAIPANMPFTAPRIIGIERKVNYALYDLLLLLIIFLHRFMLKSLGLWKESTPEIELREDVEYPLTQDDMLLIVEGRGDEVGEKYVKLHDQTGPQPNTMNLDSVKNVEIRPNDDMSDGDEEDNEAGPSKPPDRHFMVNDDQEPIIAVTTILDDKQKHFPNVMLLALKRYLRPTKHFFQRMLYPSARVTADVYAYMFLCDFFNFMVVIFGFAAFGTHQGDGGVQAYLEENKVPVAFLIMLILQFILIIIDRALYLRKFMLGKILFQHALIVGVHVWMFFVLPFITERTFNTRLPPPIWYMIKCIYLLLSAYQIRCGYPHRIIGNFLCKSYYFLNMICFRGFMAVPFVFELRTLMDWMWTDTSMTLMDWLKMEDIFANVFLLKCSRYLEDEYPQARGEKKSSTSKYILGGAVLTFVVAIIWFPLVFFAFGDSVGEPNPPTDVTVKIRIGPFLPIYQMSAQGRYITVFSEQDYTQLSNSYTRDRYAQTFLSNYMYNDVAVITINPNSTMKWNISPPELRRLQKEAMSNATLSVRFTYVLTHPTNAVPNPPVLDDFREVLIPPSHNNGTRDPDRDILLQMLNGTAPANSWLRVKLLFPKFLKVFNKGSLKPANQLMPPPVRGRSEDSPYYRDVDIRLERENDVMYWRVQEHCEQSDFLSSIPMNHCDMLVMYTFNDKLFPETLNFISGSGIIGLYTTFVFLASRVLRGFFSGIYTKIMFDDLPNVDRVLQLCLDIYLVREALELSLEEDLFAKLVFLYRSPETMIKWTRPKEENPEVQRALPPSR